MWKTSNESREKSFSRSSMKEKRKEFSSGEERKIIENEKLMEVFISPSNVESSCFSSDTSFRMRELRDAARENLPFAHFSSM